MDFGTQIIKGTAPSKSNCYRIIIVKGDKRKGEKDHGGLKKTDALVAYERAFYMQCGKYRNLKIDSFFEFYVDVYYPSNRSDLDNSLKTLLDCLQYTKTITNDNKCIQIHARKFIDAADPRVEFRIVTIDN